MTTIKLVSTINGDLEDVFDLARSIDLHLHSTTKTKEKAIAGKITGLIGLNERVTWRAKHFGVYQNFESKITQFHRPYSFTDEMVRGAFKSFKHLHCFENNNGRTIMIDIIHFQSPLGWLGRIVSRWILKPYLSRFLEERNAILKSTIEQREYKHYFNYKP